MNTAPIKKDPHNLLNVTNSEISFTEFPDGYAFKKGDYTLPLKKLEEYITNPPGYASKVDCYYLKLATFGEKPSPKGCFRCDANVTSVTGAEGDYDGHLDADGNEQWMSIEEAERRLRAANVKCYFYTSASYTEAKPKWRAIIPLSVAYSGTEEEMRAHRKQMVARIDNLLGYVFANESYRLSQSFYIGQVDGVEYKSFLLEGDYVDQREDLAVDIKAKNKAGVGGNGGPFNMEEIVRLIHTGKNYHDSTCSLVGHYIGKGNRQQDAIAAIEFTYNVSPIKNTCVKWQDRFDSIPGLVKSAFDKYGEEAAARKAARDPNIAMAGIDIQMVTMQVNETAQLITLGSYRLDDVKQYNQIADMFLSLPDIQNRYLTNYNDTLYLYEDGGYIACKPKWLINRVTNFIPKCYNLNARGEPEHGNPGRNTVNSVGGCIMAALVDEINDKIPTPFYRHGVMSADQTPADKLIVFRNGSLDMETGAFYEPTPELFALNVLPYDYEKNSPLPKRFMQFKDELWPDDNNSHLLLQEIFGYLISGETNMQKIFLLIGASRGGKGIIGGLIKAMVGEHNICGTTLQGVAGDFGMQGMLNKKVWLVADARTGKHTDQATVVERLLTISGGDPVAVQRKKIDDITTKMTVRTVIMSNMMPMLHEPSGALINRLVTLKFTRSFAGREDPNLDKKLLSELSGIVNWSLEGLKRLRSNGKFTVAASDEDMKDEFDELNNPLSGFVGEVIAVDANSSETIADVYLLWNSFRYDRDINTANNKRAFGHLLRQVVPSVVTCRKSVGKKQVKAYKGIRIIREKSIEIDGMHEFGDEMMESFKLCMAYV